MHFIFVPCSLKVISAFIKVILQNLNGSSLIHQEIHKNNSCRKKLENFLQCNKQKTLFVELTMMSNF